MAQGLDEQIMTIERSLGERMISHALVIARAWLNELGENNPYEQAYSDIRSQYAMLFEQWLTSDDPQHEQRLDDLTTDTYRLVDAAYTSIRLQRGLSPQIHGFNPDNPQSVMHYFSNCLRFKDADYQWFLDVVASPDSAALALMAVSALAHNIRECFNERALLVLIEGIQAENDVVAEQCLANAILLLAHYDVRLCSFHRVEQAFLDALSEMADEGEQAYQTLCALVRSVKITREDKGEAGELSVEDLPEELRSLLELTGNGNDIRSVESWLPKSEIDYMQGLIQILPDTWVFEVLIGDSQERATNMALTYLSIGRMDLLWERIDVAASWLRRALRKQSDNPVDYINYGHCMLLQGDKMMAYEYYRQARQICKGPKEFFALFRPDRARLVEKGIPVEFVYLMEDQLLNN